jgi:predicted amidohydrolase YtcJ
MPTVHRVALVLAAILAATGAAAQTAPDLIVHNANVITLDRNDSRAEAVAVRDGRIISVGSNAAVLRLAVPETRTLDARGRPVVPGFYDSHVHLALLSTDFRRVKLSDVDSIEMMVERLRARAAATPKGEWIEGASDWHESQLKEGRYPTRFEIDAATPDHPVFIRRGGHNVIVNSMGLKLAGIAENAADPPGGHFHRDGQGRVTGWITERPAFAAVERLLKPLNPQEYVAAMKAGMAVLSAHGVTSVRDMHVSAESVRAWQKLWAANDLPLRGNLMLTIHPRRPAKEDIDQWGSLGIFSGFGDDWLRIGGFKMTYDGGVEASLQYEDFANKAGYKGTPIIPLEKIKAISEWACRNDWRVTVHALGDRAIDDVLGVYEGIDKTCALPGRRWALEHPYLPSAAAIHKIKRLGVQVTTQTGHNYFLGVGWLEYLGKDRAHKLIPNRTYIDNGILPAGGTDAPAGPFDPFLALWADVTRETRAAGVLGQDQAVTPLEALKMHTLWTAMALGEDDRKGSIEVGKLADMVVLSDDVLAVPRGRIREVRALTTIVGGKIAYQRQ